MEDETGMAFWQVVCPSLSSQHITKKQNKTNPKDEQTSPEMLKKCHLMVLDSLMPENAKKQTPGAVSAIPYPNKKNLPGVMFVNESASF